MIRHIILLVILAQCAHAQDKDMEEKYFYDRQRIEKLGIKEIKESVFQEWNEVCSRDLALLRFVYSFDKKGNLIRVDEYLDGKDIRKSIMYERETNGRYTSKVYVYYDRLTLSRSERKWEFEFDQEGRPIVERLKYDSNYTLTNIITYDRQGNYSSQVRYKDSQMHWEWHFSYNEHNSIIASRECNKRGDSLVCFKFKRYKYKDGLLLSEEMIYPNRPDSIWNVIAYSYDDHKRLIQITDQMHHTTKFNNEPVENVSQYSLLKYDEKGNCIEKSLSRKDKKPFRCYYYSYTYH